MIQSLEIYLHAYIGLSKNDCANYLNTLELSYNTTPHIATGFAFTYFLKGYIPTTRSTLVYHPEGIARLAIGMDSHTIAITK
jgi:hypothetical protein